MDPAAAKMIGAGLAMIGAIGAGLGVGMATFGGVQGIAEILTQLQQFRPT